MLNQDQIELIHREIDGANTPAESAAFRSLIEEDPEAKAYEADLRHVALLLDQVEDGEPSRHLKRAILDALPEQVRATSGWEAFAAHARAVVDGFRKRPRFALASALGVGLVAGFAAHAALGGARLTDPPGTVGLTGTFFEPHPGDESDTIDEVRIDIEGVSGRVGVRTVQDIVYVELELDAEQALEVRLTFDPGSYDLRGFSRLRGEAGSHLAAEPGRIRITTSGANTHAFILNQTGSASSLSLSLSDDGGEIFSTPLQTRRADRGG